MLIRLHHKNNNHLILLNTTRIVSVEPVDAGAPAGPALVKYDGYVPAVVRIEVCETMDQIQAMARPLPKD